MIYIGARESMTRKDCMQTTRGLIQAMRDNIRLWEREGIIPEVHVMLGRKKNPGVKNEKKD